MDSRISKNIFLQTILNFVNLIIPIITGSYVIRILSVGSYGIFNEANAYLSFIIVLSSLSISNIGIRELSKRESRENISKIFSELFFLRGFVNACTLVLSLYLIDRFISDFKIIYILVAMQIFTKIFEVEWVLIAKEEFKFITIKTIAIKIMNIGLLIMFVRNPNDLLNYAIISFIVPFVNEFLSFFLVMRETKLTFRNLNFLKHVKPLFNTTMIFNILLLYSNIDKIFLAKFVDNYSVSSYNIILNITSMVSGLFYGICLGVQPRINYLINDNIENFNFLVKKTSNLYFFMLIPFMMGLAALSRETLLVYSGMKYSNIYLALVLGVFTIIAQKYCAFYEMMIFFPAKKEKQVLIVTAAFGICNVLSNVVLAMLNILTIETTLFCSFINNILIFISYEVYKRKKIKKINSFLSKNQILYFLISILFFIIHATISLITNNVLIIIFLTVICSVIVYASILTYLKDENYVIIFRRIKKLYFEKILKKFD